MWRGGNTPTRTIRAINDNRKNEILYPYSLPFLKNSGHRNLTDVLTTEFWNTHISDGGPTSYQKKEAFGTNSTVLIRTD